MRKRLVTLLLTALLVMAAWPVTASAAPGGTINVYNWGQYIYDGTDGSLDVIAAFEEETGIKVNYTTFDSNESLNAKMKSGGATYDVIFPSDYMVGKMIEEGMLAPLDYSNIPNLAAIGPEYLGWDFDPDNTYSVPYTWGTTGLIYNTTLVDEAPTSWSALWDMQYANNVLMFNNSRDAYAIAAKKLGLSLRRFKTGTPPRVSARSVDFSKMELQPGDEEVLPFSFETKTPPENRAICWLTYTNQKTHDIIRANLDRSPLYDGTIEGVGPLYCPSI